MARKLRLEAEDGIYHVLNRGNYRAAIFQSDKTKAAFLTCLDEACGKTGWRVHAWCLMSNHYHLAVETPRANLVEEMQWLQGTFSTRCNRLRHERGHLFQDEPAATADLVCTGCRARPRRWFDGHPSRAGEVFGLPGGVG